MRTTKKESMDKYYSTIKMKMQTPKKTTSATFQTDNDVFTVNLSENRKRPLIIAGEAVTIEVVSISFSSRNMSMGHSSDTSNMENNLYVYPTVMKIIELFANERRKAKIPVMGFTCTVAGDNERGSKKGIYELLFNRAPKFGYHRWKKELLAIPLDIYNRLKTDGFQTPSGQIVFDSALR